MAVMTEVTPVEYVGIAVGLMSAIFGVSSILGTVLGGIIVSSTSWRWVFFLNLPPGITSLIVVIFIFPVNSEPLPITWRTIKGIDFFGVTLFLIGCVPLIFALESGGMHYEWNDAPIIVSFTLGGIGLISFAMWQWYISKRFQNNYLLPLVPASLVSQRTTGFSMLAAFFTGFPFMATIIFLPQRLQLQNGLTPIRAGIDMLPLLLLSATGAAVCGMVAARSKIGGMAWYLLVGSLPLQMFGLGLMSTLPKSAGPVPAQQYVFQVFLGLGFGIALSSLAIVARLEVSKDDISVVMGAITQVRVLGGLVGIAIGQAVISSRITSELGPVLGPDRLAAILQSITAIQMFPSDLANLVRESYGQSFSLQHKVMIGFAAAALLSCLAAWKHNFENMQELEKKRVEREMQSSCTGLSPMVEVPARLEGDIRDSGYELTDRGIHGRINQ
ncbi:major facilitator superfamily transporter [Pochonia chlamydosporia 170]|uniref:Major facilitator superfamily transporter n=1 Tax=Pochonia chlamydosporia 170 TaxID=1380566 RepID=A0A179EWQ8_METCM|nr:major facilitator superfamily transporter [Pochonia chlamydosporia 170]OAQ57608.1 major facilitator superfamily transporter [Pochonia chlamydosporia 170]